VQQAHKEDRITFTALSPWPGGGYVCADGRYMEGETEKRAATARPDRNESGFPRHAGGASLTH